MCPINKHCKFALFKKSFAHPPPTSISQTCSNLNNKGKLTFVSINIEMHTFVCILSLFPSLSKLICCMKILARAERGIQSKPFELVNKKCKKSLNGCYRDRLPWLEKQKIENGHSKLRTQIVKQCISFSYTD